MQVANNSTLYFFDVECSVDEKAERTVRKQANATYLYRPVDCTSLTLEQWEEKCARDACLKAEYSRVLVMSLIVENADGIVKRCIIGIDSSTGRFFEDEAQCLHRIWNHYAPFNPATDLLIGHNVLNFDLPFLIKRSIIHKIKPSIHPSFARYRAQPIFDTMQIWQRWNGAISLDTLAQTLGLESSKQGINGSQVYDFYRAGRHREIADYCARDVLVTREIYRRLTFAE